MKAVSYNIGCLSDDAFEGNDEFYNKLCNDLQLLARENNVLCFQEVNDNWRAIIKQILGPLGHVLVDFPFHDEGITGLCISTTRR